MKNKPIKVGYIQFQPALCNPQKSLFKLQRLFTKINEADIIVLPELANSGYNFESREQAFQFAEETSGSHFIDFLIDKAKELNAYIVSGFNEKSKKKIFNSALLISPEGIKGKYRKVHLFMNEKDYFSTGDKGFPVFDIGICKIGIMICFDYLFPESWRILGLKGADLICHPSNFITPYPQKVIPSHSVVNKYYIITTNRIGTEGELNFTGKSMIIDPEGDIIKQASSDKEEVLIKDINICLSLNKMITPRNHVFDDRHPEQYTDLVC